MTPEDISAIQARNACSYVRKTMSLHYALNPTLTLLVFHWLARARACDRLGRAQHNDGESGKILQDPTGYVCVKVCHFDSIICSYMYLMSTPHTQRPSIYRQRIFQLSKMPFELLRHLTLRICHNRSDQRVVVVHESVPLPCLGNTLALLDQECLILSPQPAETAGDGLVIASLAA
jgi:hypothetical protein